MKITVVYDNEAPPPFKSDWGFACLVETKETTLLFDTGAKGELRLENMERLGIDPRTIQAVVLSHDHWDHTGGLRDLLNINSKLTVFKPTYSKEPIELFINLMTTGTLKSWLGIQEQALLCKTDDGLVVITGCSHPGLENFLVIAKKLGRIYAIIGGFHGFNKFNELMDIPLIVPCHCTSHKREIYTIFSDTSKKGGVGKIIELKELGNG